MSCSAAIRCTTGEYRRRVAAVVRVRGPGRSADPGPAGDGGARPCRADPREHHAHIDRLTDATRISANVPAAGAGTSVSILSVEISQMVCSASTWSPTATGQATIVPSATDTPIWGIVTSINVSVGEELTARLLDAVDAGQDGLLQRGEKGIGTSGVATRTTGPSRSSKAFSAISAATWAPAAQVMLASSTITTFEQRATESRIASSSSGTSERRSSTSIDASSRSSVADSATSTIAP